MFAVAAETFPGKIVLEDAMVRISPARDVSGRAAESATPDMTAYASQTLECISYGFFAPQTANEVGLVFL